MSSESRYEVEVQLTFIEAVVKNEFSQEDMKEMLIKAAQLMNSFEIMRIVSMTHSTALLHLLK